jgi:trehalose 6-phosphate synthase/phosphatase
VNRRRILVVSNRLPISVERKEGGWHTQRTVGGLASALSAVAAYTDLQWIGWPGLTTNDPAAQAAIAEQLGREHNCRPVFIPNALFDRYYHGFSNGCLWPLFHYFPRTARYEAAAWEAYRAVNELFAERVAANARPGDCIWIHDYHLLLLPALLRQRLPEAALGFFLHIPFPSYELFRELPWREALLRGLLGADLVGFHTYDYTRHFLNSLLRGLGLEQDFGQVPVDGRTVRVDTFPLGVDTAGLEQAARSAGEAAAGRKTRGRRQGDYRLILSVDRLDFTKGIPQRLMAFDRFLARYPEWRERVRLLLICVPSRERVPAYKELKRQVDELVGLVNGKYSTPSWTPIQYLYRSFDVAELAGFYRQAHVALVTPLRDGMNLVAKE